MMVRKSDDASLLSLEALNEQEQVLVIIGGTRGAVNGINDQSQSLVSFLAGSAVWRNDVSEGVM